GVYLHFQHGWHRQGDFGKSEANIVYAFQRFAQESDKIYFYSLEGVFRFLFSLNSIDQVIPVEISVDAFLSEYQQRLSEI
ncbi:MAG TPA: hypothetical protein VIH61_08540, partial [Waddliaceae bacterium]